MKRNKSAIGRLLEFFNERPFRLGTAHNDKLFPEIRWVAFLIVPFLLTGALVLLIWPDDTDVLFAWPMRSRVTALVLGATYAGGVYYFSRVFLSRQWHVVSLGILPAAAFAVLGAAATVVHWNLFSHSTFAFIIWLVIYAIAPWLFPLLWMRNRTQDTRRPIPQDVLLSRGIAGACLGIGALTLAAGIVVVVVPDLLAAIWPWEINPLEGSILGAIFSTFGAGLLGLGFDRRWSSAQVIFETTALIAALILLGLARSWNVVRLENPLTWILAGWTLLLLVFAAVYNLWVEIR